MNGCVEPACQVGWARYNPEGTDSYGNPTDGWGNPVLVQVYGFAPPEPDQTPGQAGRHQVARHLDLYVPPGVAGGPRDRWQIPGEEGSWEQVGHVQDYTHGPFSFTPGGRIRLQQVEG